MSQGEKLFRGAAGRVAVDLGAVGQWPEVDDRRHQDLDVLGDVTGCDHRPGLVDVDVGRSEHRDLGKARISDEDHPHEAHEDRPRPGTRSAKSTTGRHGVNTIMCRLMRPIESREVVVILCDLRAGRSKGIGFRGGGLPQFPI